MRSSLGSPQSFLEPRAHRRKFQAQSRPSIVGSTWHRSPPSRNGRRASPVDCSVDQAFAIRMRVEQVEDGQFLATSTDLPGLVAHGRTAEEALEIAADVGRRLLGSYREHDDPVPSGMRTLGTVFEVDVVVTS